MGGRWGRGFKADSRWARIEFGHSPSRPHNQFSDFELTTKAAEWLEWDLPSRPAPQPAAQAPLPYFHPRHGRRAPAGPRQGPGLRRDAKPRLSFQQAAPGCDTPGLSGPAQGPTATAPAGAALRVAGLRPRLRRRASPWPGRGEGRSTRSSRRRSVRLDYLREGGRTPGRRPGSRRTAAPGRGQADGEATVAPAVRSAKRGWGQVETRVSRYDAPRGAGRGTAGNNVALLRLGSGRGGAGPTCSPSRMMKVSQSQQSAAKSAARRTMPASCGAAAAMAQARPMLGPG